MNGLLDAVGAGKVIVFGHDWCASRPVISLPGQAF